MAPNYDFPSEYLTDYPMDYPLKYPMDYPMDCPMDYPMDYPIEDPIENTTQWTEEFHTQFWHKSTFDKYPGVCLWMDNGTAVSNSEKTGFKIALLKTADSSGKEWVDLKLFNRTGEDKYVHATAKVWFTNLLSSDEARKKSLNNSVDNQDFAVTHLFPYSVMNSYLPDSGYLYMELQLNSIPESEYSPAPRSFQVSNSRYLQNERKGNFRKCSRSPRGEDFSNPHYSFCVSPRSKIDDHQPYPLFDRQWVADYLQKNGYLPIWEEYAAAFVKHYPTEKPRFEDFKDVIDKVGGNEILWVVPKH